MATNHLVTLKAMCLNADILGKVEQREALGWALARLNELTGTKVAEALSGSANEALVQEVQTAKAKCEDLELFARFICQQNRIDIERMRHRFAALGASVQS